jgi:hypothetical protein
VGWLAIGLLILAASLAVGPVASRAQTSIARRFPVTVSPGPANS